MNIDIYKELIKFNILLGDYNLINIKYLAADADGSVWGYNNEPYVDNRRWIDFSHENVAAITPIEFYKASPHDKWEETLIIL